MYFPSGLGICLNHQIQRHAIHTGIYTIRRHQQRCTIHFFHVTPCKTKCNAKLTLMSKVTGIIAVRLTCEGFQCRVGSWNCVIGRGDPAVFSPRLSWYSIYEPGRTWVNNLLASNSTLGFESKTSGQLQERISRQESAELEAPLVCMCQQSVAAVGHVVSGNNKLWETARC